MRSQTTEAISQAIAETVADPWAELEAACRIQDRKQLSELLITGIARRESPSSAPPPSGERPIATRDHEDHDRDGRAPFSEVSPLRAPPSDPEITTEYVDSSEVEDVESSTNLLEPEAIYDE